MNKVLKEENNETHGTERKHSQIVPEEMDPEWPTMRHSLGKLMDFKEKNYLGILVKKKKSVIQEGK